MLGEREKGSGCCEGSALLPACPTMGEERVAVLALCISAPPHIPVLSLPARGIPCLLLGCMRTLWRIHATRGLACYPTPGEGRKRASPFCCCPHPTTTTCLPAAAAAWLFPQCAGLHLGRHVGGVVILVCVGSHGVVCPMGNNLLCHA